MCLLLCVFFNSCDLDSRFSRDIIFSKHHHFVNLKNLRIANPDGRAFLPGNEPCGRYLSGVIGRAKAVRPTMCQLISFQQSISTDILITNCSLHYYTLQKQLQIQFDLYLGRTTYRIRKDSNDVRIHQAAVHMRSLEDHVLEI